MQNHYSKDMHQFVERILEKVPATRDSDIELYKVILQELYGTTDISKLYLKANIFMTITRCRQKVQERNPFLGPTKTTSNNRKKAERSYRSYARDY